MKVQNIFSISLIAAGAFAFAPVLTSNAQVLQSAQLPTQVEAHDLNVAAQAAPSSGICAVEWDVSLGDPGFAYREIHALMVYEGDLVAGGTFTEAGGREVNHIARWDGTSWHSLGSGVSGPVRALAVHRSDLYVGGFFTHADGQFVNHIARWDGESWHPLGSGMNAAVMALHEHDGALHAGGLFTMADDVETSYIARWDGSAWQALGGGVGGTVTTMTSHAGDLIVGGTFTDVDGELAERVARWNGLNWSGLVGPIEEMALDRIGHGVPKLTWGLLSLGDELLITGAFIHLASDGEVIFAGGGSIPGCGPFCSSFRSALWRGNAWIPLPIESGPNNAIYALHEHDGHVYAGGSFTFLGSTGSPHLARWSGHGWLPIDSGIGGAHDTSIRAMTTYNGALVVAGSFAEAGGQEAFSIAAARDVPVSAGAADLNCDGLVNIFDLALLLENWGPCPDPAFCPADLNGDGVVDVFDLLIMLQNWS